MKFIAFAINLVSKQLYREEVESILKEMGKDMTAIEERVWELAEEFGIREKSIQEGREQDQKRRRAHGVVTSGPNANPNGPWDPPGERASRSGTSGARREAGSVSGQGRT